MKLTLTSENNFNTTELSGTEYVSSFPRGVYTTFRTVHKEKSTDYMIMCMKLHSERLTLGYLNFITDKDLKAKYEKKEEKEKLNKTIKQMMCEMCSKLIIEFKNRNTKEITEATDFRVYVQVRPDEINNKKILMEEFIEVLPDQNPNKNEIILHLGHRNNPNVKDIEWVNKRKALEEIMRLDKYEGRINELVLLDEEGKCYEGISSNFFIMKKDGSLETAPKELVLIGTLRQMIFEAAKELNIKIIEKCPNIKEINEWAYAYSTSTSRKARSISKFHLYKSDNSVEEIEISKNRTDIANKNSLLLKQKIDELIISDAESIQKVLNFTN